MLKRLVEAHRGSDSCKHNVISLTSIGKVGVQLQELGIEVHAMGMRSALDIPLVMWRLVRLIRTSRPDVVQTWMYHADLLGGLAAKFSGGIPVIWGVHSFDLKRGGSLQTRVVQKLCAIFSRWLPHTIQCVAEASRRVHVALGYEASRFVVLPNGFDVSIAAVDQCSFTSLRAHYGLHPEDIVIGCVGRFNPAKDHQNFVKAAALVGQRYPKARFLMVGSKMDAGNQILGSWIHASGIPERFVLLGERSDVPVCLAAMDVFCSSSRTEAFPLVVGEAMLMSRPAVVTDVGDTAYLLGNCGVIVPSEDSAALAQGMEQLLSLSAEERQTLGRSARARIEQEFSMERYTQRFEAVYAEVVNNPRGR
jgi:glycosyltransferase involved in cell wall biosynthesis